jgi:hypothetical protein
VGAITDDKMLVFVTLLYVFLTYKLMKNNFSIYQYQRIPQLFISARSDTATKPGFEVKNKSDFHAVDLLVTFEIIYPVPEEFFHILNVYVHRNYIEKLKNFTRKNKKSDYMIRYFSEYLEPQDTMYMTLEQEINQLIDIESIKNQNELDRVERDLQIIAKYEYKSLDNLSLEKPFYKRFKFRIEPTGINLIHISGNPVKLD